MQKSEEATDLMMTPLNQPDIERDPAVNTWREGEHLFRAMADTTPVMIWMSGTDKSCYFFNQGWLNFTGRTMEVESGNGWAEGVHPDDFDRCLQTYVEAFDARRNFTMEYRLRRADGEYRWLLDTGVPRYLPGGEFVGYIGTCIDINERKEGEEAQTEYVRLAALSADVGVAFTADGSLKDMLRECTEALVRHLHAAFARVWTLDEAGKVLELQASSGMYTHLDGPHARVPVGKFKIGLIAEQRQPHLTNSVIGDPRVADQEWAKHEGMVAFAGYPLIVEERLVGVMAVFARHILTEVALDSMASVSNGIALGIERKHAEARLLKSRAELESRVVERTAELSNANAELEAQIAERRRIEGELQKEREFLGALLDNLAEGIVACDAEGVLTLFNRATREFHGLPEEKIPAERWAAHYDLYLPDGRTRMRREDVPLFRALEGHPVRDVEMVIAPKNGSTRTLLANGQPIIDGDGKKLGAVVAMHDITERKRAEEERERLLREQIEREQMLAELSTPLVPVWKDVLVLPIVGSLDTERMERATEAALGEVTRTCARACIIDITGARIIDSHAVARLSHLVSALRLIGAEAIVTGISAHAAQNLVGLGLDLQGMRTHRTLAEALAAIIKTTTAGYTIKDRSRIS
ncbi:MAG: PAS domain S-box protein [Acidobacteriota bacterium]|nr:PAS domain S-box protein [Acidobacteriota bacterium]